MSPTLSSQSAVHLFVLWSDSVQKTFWGGSADGGGGCPKAQAAAASQVRRPPARKWGSETSAVAVAVS